MTKYKITFREWDEYGVQAIRTIHLETDKNPQAAFYDLQNDCDVQFLKAEQIGEYYLVDYTEDQEPILRHMIKAGILDEKKCLTVRIQVTQPTLTIRKVTLEEFQKYSEI